MLTEAGCQARQERLWQQIPQEIEWLLVGDARHVQYLCGYLVNPISFSAGERALLLLSRDGKSALLADNFARRTVTVPFFVTEEIIVPWYTHRRSVSSRPEALNQALHEAKKYWSGRTGLIEPEGITEMSAATVAEDAAWQFAADEDSKPQTLGDVIRQLRRSKDADELDLLRHCMRACEAGHKRALQVVAPGMTELQVYLEVQRAAQEAAGAPCVVYGDFRATHSHLHKAGGHPTDYVLRDGDLLILDYSVVIHGYRSDFTNTIAAGTPSSAAQDQYAACLRAMQAAEQLLCDGQPCDAIWQVASDELEDAGFGQLAHHAGHGLGQEHPEPPILVRESTDELIAGDVITLEPGCYIEGTGGIRIEHNYVIEAEGFERLSNHELRLN
ncbi:MAG: M24 family metallopeptidase [Planctomycetaceae bacterium]